jgi:nicotinate-nucleotide adenylyltransferase
MVNLAVEDNNKLRASDIEFKMPQPSYTIDTLTYLKEKYPENEFCLIMGEDNLRSFHKWKNYERILKAHKLLVYPRVLTGEEIDKEQKLNTIIDPNHFDMIDAPLMKIAASFIRNSIMQKKDVRYLLTEPVWKYCNEMSFYR